MLLPENVICGRRIFEKWAYKAMSSEMNIKYNKQLEGKVNMPVAQEPYCYLSRESGIHPILKPQCKCWNIHEVVGGGEAELQRKI